MKRFFASKWVKYPFYTFTLIFAAIGFFLCAAYMAIHFRWTDQKGEVDKNSRYLTDINLKHTRVEDKDSIQLENEKFETFERIGLLQEYYPVNASNILQALSFNNDYSEAMRMLDALDIATDSSSAYFSAVERYKANRKPRKVSSNTQNVYAWMNSIEWSDLKIAIEKDKHLIDSVEKVTGVEARLIVCCLIGEQIRLFNSDREIYKTYIGPLKVLSVENKFSFGVTGIKKHTARNIEQHLKNPASEYYLGQEYEHLLDFKTAAIDEERMSRLVNYRNHYYSYLYAAVFLKQVHKQWQNAGFPIDSRPEILTTLFNVGYPQSVPKSNPMVGGSSVLVKGKKYSFGMIGFQFYYSGELVNLFPIHSKKFDWNTVSNEPTLVAQFN